MISHISEFLRPISWVSSTTTYLIIAVVALIAVVGILGGYILGKGKK